MWSAAVLPPLLRCNERDLLDRIVEVVDAGTLKAGPACGR
jgi:hypothetical protein